MALWLLNKKRDKRGRIQLKVGGIEENYKLGDVLKFSIQILDVEAEATETSITQIRARIYQPNQTDAYAYDSQPALCTTGTPNQASGYIDVLTGGWNLGAETGVYAGGYKLPTTWNVAYEGPWIITFDVVVDGNTYGTTCGFGVARYDVVDLYDLLTSGTYGLSALNDDLDTLLGRLTAARAGYLDNLDISDDVASSSEASAIQTEVNKIDSAACSETPTTDSLADRSDDIQAKTDNLPSDPADQSVVEAAITASETNIRGTDSDDLKTLSGQLDAISLEATSQSILTEVNKIDSAACSGTPTADSLADKADDISTQIAAVPTVGEIDTELTSSHSGGAWTPADVSALALEASVQAVPTAVEIDTQLSGTHGSGSWEGGGCAPPPPGGLVTPDIFGVNIAGELNKALGPLVFDLTLTVVTPSTRDDITDGTQPTTTNYTVKGFVDDYKERQIDGTIIQEGDQKITLLGGSLGSIVPKPNDKITAETRTKTIIDVERDPAGATYLCQVR